MLLSCPAKWNSWTAKESIDMLLSGNGACQQACDKLAIWPVGYGVQHSGMPTADCHASKHAVMLDSKHVQDMLDILQPYMGQMVQYGSRTWNVRGAASVPTYTRPFDFCPLCSACNAGADS